MRTGKVTMKDAMSDGVIKHHDALSEIVHKAFLAEIILMFLSLDDLLVKALTYAVFLQNHESPMF